MYSFSIDYLFNRVYDVLLWIKYAWFFGIMRTDPQAYLDAHKDRAWDGLRDRGWFDAYLQSMREVVPRADVHISLWQKILESLGFNLKDSDGDGIVDIADASPYDADNLSGVQLKERYQIDYTFSDSLRDFFGIGPKDSDSDGVPNSYEASHGLNSHNPDSDSDGVFDGQEIVQETDPLDPDTDYDGVLDGRDEAPEDRQTSSIGTDTDHDGVSDRVEEYIATNTHKEDTDGDGITDGMDTYPLDYNNLSQVQAFDISPHVEGLHLSIQNPVLALLSGFLSVLAVLFLLVLVYVSMRWFIVFLTSLNHYEHHFAHGEESGHGIHTIEHVPHGTEGGMPAGVPGLPIYEEEVPATPPTQADFKDHPRFAIIQGYMSSPSEALWRIGIMEADNMLAEVLREKGYKGEGLGEILQNAHFNTVNLAWDVHKVRNRIAHEGSDFVLTEHEARRVFLAYQSIFQELKVVH